MTGETRDLKSVWILVDILTIVNVLLAFNFFPLVPLLGWFNYGHAGWATAWIPDLILLLVLPAGYYIYWHYWFVVGGSALLGSLYLNRRSSCLGARRLAVVNGAAVLMYLLVRAILAVQGIHPDIV